MSGQRSHPSPTGASDGGTTTVVRSRDGVRVEKTLSDEAAAIPVVEYEIESTRSTAVAVSLRDTIPDGVAADEVGFHADYEADRWRKTDDGVEFRRSLAPNERVVTVVGLRTASVPDPDAFATEPELSVLGGDGSGAADASGGSADVGGDAPADGSTEADQSLGPTDGEPAGWERRMDRSPIERSFADAAPAADHETDDGDATDDDDDAPPTLDLDDPLGDGPAGPGGDASEVPDDGEPGTSGVDGAAADRRLDADDDVVAALVDAFRDGRVDAADRELLRNELNLELADSTASFVEHLQARADRERDRLTAELDGLADSITDLYGLKADANALTDVEARVDAVEDAAARAERVETLADRLRALDDRAAEESDLDDVAARLDDLAADAARADDLERVAEAARELAAEKAAERDVAALERSLQSRIERTRSDLDTRVDAVEDAAATEAALSDVEDRLAALRERVAALETDADDLADAEARLDTAVTTLAEEVDALDERAAAASDLESVEATLREEYVTEADVETVVESRLDQGVGRFVALALGSGALLSSLTLAVTAGATAAGVAAAAGVALLATRWYLGRRGSPPERVGV